MSLKPNGFSRWGRGSAPVMRGKAEVDKKTAAEHCPAPRECRLRKWRGGGVKAHSTLLPSESRSTADRTDRRVGAEENRPPHREPLFRFRDSYDDADTGAEARSGRAPTRKPEEDGNGTELFS